MSEPRISAGAGTKGTGRRVDGGSEEYETTGVFAAEGLVLVGGLRVGGNHVRCAELAWMVL